MPCRYIILRLTFTLFVIIFALNYRWQPYFHDLIRSNIVILKHRTRNYFI